MFEPTDRITFLTQIAEIDQDWWVSEFYDQHGLTPENVGDRLSAAWLGEKATGADERGGHGNARRRRLPVNLRQTKGNGGVLDELVKNQAEADRRQLSLVADEQQTTVGLEALEDGMNCRQVDHRRLVEDDQRGVGDSAQAIELFACLSSFLFRRVRIRQQA
jgi:hypothetical protein